MADTAATNTTGLGGRLLPGGAAAVRINTQPTPGHVSWAYLDVMSRIFLSHSSRDAREAVALKRWLAEKDSRLANEIFLDLDKDTGITAGVRWKDALRQASSRCEAVICLLSTNWDASHECKTEFRMAEYLNKQIFCARLEPLAGRDVTAEWQRCDLFGDGPKTEIDIGDGSDLVLFLSEGLQRLWEALGGAGIGAKSFPWPPPGQPDRSPYRGWEPLQEVDAAVFFGRDAPIIRGLDALRGMRKSGVETLFVVLGPSGAGKSSFLRAGLLPRLRREDRHFLVLDIVRPARRALDGTEGLAQAIHTTRKRLGLPLPTLGEVKSACQTDVDQVRELLIEAQRQASARLVDHPGELAPPTVVLPVDQAEELFTSDAGPQARQFLELIARLARDDGAPLGLIVAATIRMDRYQAFEDAPELAGVNSVVFNELKPMPPTQFKEVITGPAARATASGRTLRIAPDLVDRLLDDCAEGGDTLPLLSLTLDRLYRDYESAGELTLSQYEAMGGMRNVVQTEIDEVLSDERSEKSRELDLLRAAFIPWLATIDPDTNQPMRRIARWTDLPEPSRPLVEAFVAKRLLVKDERDNEIVVEVALESLLRQWADLATWLADEAGDLKDADALERSAAAWADSDRNEAWLLVGERLSRAETLVAKPGFRARLDSAREFLVASRQREDERKEAEAQQKEEKLRVAQAHAAVLRRRSRVLAMVLAVTVLVAATAVAGFVLATAARKEADARNRDATALRLASQGEVLLAGAGPGGDVRAMLQLLAAHRLRPHSADAGLLEAVMTRSFRTVTDSGAGGGATALSAGGRRFVSVGHDGVAVVLEVETGQPTGEPFTVPAGTVESVAISPDGSRIAASGRDGAVRDGIVRVWDADTGQPVGTPITGAVSGASRVVFSPDGRRIAASSWDRGLRVWDVDTGQTADQLNGVPGAFSVAFSPDGRRIATGFGNPNGGVQVWDAETGQPVGPRLPSDLVASLAFSPDGRRIAVGIGTDFGTGGVTVLDTVTGRPVGQPVFGGSAMVHSLSFSPDGRRVVSGGLDGVRMWDADTGQQVGQPLTEGWVDSVAFSTDGQEVITGSRDGNVRVWEPGTAADIGRLIGGSTGDAVGAAFIGAEGRIAISKRDGSVQVWDARTGEPAGDLSTGPASMSGVSFSPDGSRIATTGPDGVVRVWDADTGQPVGTPITGAVSGLSGVRFSPGGHRIATHGVDGRVQVWEVATGKSVTMLRNDPEVEVTAEGFSPDGRRIATGTYGGTILIWDADTGESAGEPLAGHAQTVSSVVFSPDGNRIASGSLDGTIRVWDAHTGRSIGQPLVGHTSPVLTGPSGMVLFHGPTGMVTSVVFSPDGRRIVSGGADNTVRLWDVDTGQAVGQPLVRQPNAGLGSAVSSVTISPDGRHIAAHHADGTVVVWPGPDAWPDMLCAKLTNNMSRQQWREWVSPGIEFIEVCPGLHVPADDLPR